MKYRSILPIFMMTLLVLMTIPTSQGIIVKTSENLDHTTIYQWEVTEYSFEAENTSNTDSISGDLLEDSVVELEFLQDPNGVNLYAVALSDYMEYRVDGVNTSIVLDDTGFEAGLKSFKVNHSNGVGFREYRAGLLYPTFLDWENGTQEHFLEYIQDFLPGTFSQTGGTLSWTNPLYSLDIDYSTGLVTSFSYTSDLLNYTLELTTPLTQAASSSSTTTEEDTVSNLLSQGLYLMGLTLILVPILRKQK